MAADGPDPKNALEYEANGSLARNQVTADKTGTPGAGSRMAQLSAGGVAERWGIAYNADVERIGL